MKRTVITHKEMGIFLGSSMGLAFWSMLDSAGQVCAVVFDNEEDARDFVSKWQMKPDPNIFDYKEVDSVSGEYATVTELMAAGLTQMAMPLFFNMPPEGRA